MIIFNAVCDSIQKYNQLINIQSIKLKNFEFNKNNLRTCIKRYNQCKLNKSRQSYLKLIQMHSKASPQI